MNFVLPTHRHHTQVLLALSIMYGGSYLGLKFYRIGKIWPFDEPYLQQFNFDKRPCFRFRGPTPNMPGARPGPSDVITLDGPPAPEPMMRMPLRAPVPAPRGGPGSRGRGGRRGRPRLDPDTDLDFSPEPSTNSSEMLLARLQQAGINVTNNSGSGKSSGNES